MVIAVTTMISITVLSLCHVPSLLVIIELFLRTNPADSSVLFHVPNSLLEYSLKGWTKKLPSNNSLFLPLVTGTPESTT